ncbi:DUF3558 family protein [Micromonosporaceae bacterium Da 78-11]
MNRRTPAVLLGAFTVVVIAGCGLLDSKTGRDADAAAPTPTSTSTTTKATSATSPATSGMGSAKDGGNVPDPCGLLTDAEVTGLTGRDITQKDKDGAAADASVRYCQWQQDSGQLAVFLSRTTQSDFETVIEDATTEDFNGQDAFALAGHLYVMYGTVQIDVYSRGDSDGENLRKEKKVAEVLMERI